MATLDYAMPTKVKKPFLWQRFLLDSLLAAICSLCVTAIIITGKSIEMSVADRGPGIPPADREHVFDKFYRVLGNTHNANYPTTGSGLGLAVCKGLVEAHGGRIWTEPREGGEAVFLVTLPIGTAEGAAERMSV